jgi:hypothetical protein
MYEMMQRAESRLQLRPEYVWATYMLSKLAPEDGNAADDAPGRLIWLAVGIAVAIAATTFMITKYDAAKTAVPAPTPPSVP